MLSHLASTTIFFLNVHYVKSSSRTDTQQKNPLKNYLLYGTEKSCRYLDPCLN